MSAFREEYEKWLASAYISESERAELTSIANDEREIEDRFYTDLSFGTAGLRGIMGAGTNRMNVHVVRQTTQALSEVILKDGGALRAAVCYDCRTGSEEFAREAALVLAANGIEVCLFDSMRPTPELSFAVRYYGCSAGINITASHNPREYNGYKAYNSEGCQLSPEKAALVAEKRGKIDIFTGAETMDFQRAKELGLIKMVGAELDEEFLFAVMSLTTDSAELKAAAGKMKVVYTPFHGVGYKLIPEALSRLGIRNLYCEEHQMVPDGTFPTVPSPNPENKEGFALAEELAKRVDADLVIGSDPDADRVAILVPDGNGFRALSGNETGALLIDYIIGAMKRGNRLPENAAAVKTIVSTELVRDIAASEGVKCYDAFTGFKYLAEKKDELERSGEGKVIFAFEEAIGYMLGDHVRDKDAVSASVMLAEMAAYQLSKGESVLKRLDALHKSFGYHSEKTVSLVMPGIEGKKRIDGIMKRFHDSPPAEIDGDEVVLIRNYASGEETDVLTGEVRAMSLGGSDVLSYDTRCGARILVRPSGTEPKIKIYILTKDSSAEKAEKKAESLALWAEKLGE